MAILLRLPHAAVDYVRVPWISTSLILQGNLELVLIPRLHEAVIV